MTNTKFTAPLDESAAFPADIPPSFEVEEAETAARLKAQDGRPLSEVTKVLTRAGIEPTEAMVRAKQFSNEAQSAAGNRPQPGQREIAITLASEIEMRNVEWLWEAWFR